MVAWLSTKFHPQNRRLKLGEIRLILKNKTTNSFLGGIFTGVPMLGWDEELCQLSLTRSYKSCAGLVNNNGLVHCGNILTILTNIYRIVAST